MQALSINILQQKDFETVEAADGIEAIESLKNKPEFDILLTDMNFPNGMEIAEHASKLQPNIKSIFTTGYAESTTTDLSKLEADNKLGKKPYKQAELLERIYFLLNNQHS